MNIIQNLDQHTAFDAVQDIIAGALVGAVTGAVAGAGSGAALGGAGTTGLALPSEPQDAAGCRRMPQDAAGCRRSMFHIVSYGLIMCNHV